MRWYERVLPLQGLLFNLLFAAAAIALHVWVLPSVRARVDSDSLRHGIGALILLGLVLEPFALRTKFRETLRDIHGGILGDRDEDAGPRSLSLVFAWFVHLIVSAMVLLLGLQALGFGPRTYPVLYVAAATVLVLREMYLLGLIIVPPDRDSRIGGWRILVANVVLLLFAAAAYAAARTVIVERMRGLAFDFSTVVTDGILAAFLFLLMLIAMRFGFLVEEGIAFRNSNMRYVVWLTMLVAIAAAMLPFFYRV